jgi:hypothetical protein
MNRDPAVDFLLDFNGAILEQENSLRSSSTQDIVSFLITNIGTLRIMACLMHLRMPSNCSMIFGWTLIGYCGRYRVNGTVGYWCDVAGTHTTADAGDCRRYIQTSARGAENMVCLDDVLG